MCPHTLGHTNGVQQALFFQFAGQSSKGLPPGGEWKSMRVAGLSRRHDSRWRVAHRTTPHSETDLRQTGGGRSRFLNRSPQRLLLQQQNSRILLFGNCRLNCTARRWNPRNLEALPVT